MLPKHYKIITLSKRCETAIAVGNVLQIVVGSFLATRLSDIKNSRIMRISITDQLLYQYTYYHLKRDSLARKNPAFAQNLIVFAATGICQFFMVCIEICVIH